MINITEINKEFINLIGTKQSNNSEVGIISESNLLSESKQYVQELHPLLTLETLRDCASLNKFSINEYLINKKSVAINNLVNDVLREKQLSETVPDVLSEFKMFEGSGSIVNTIIPSNRFVGYKISAKYPNLSLYLKQIGLQLTNLESGFKIYVYHSAKKEPVATFEVDYTKAGSFQYVSVNKTILSSIEGGYYLIGYYEADLTGNAINRPQSLTDICESCAPSNYANYKKWAKYIEVQPFYVNNSDLSGTNKWNDTSEIEIDGYNWGLNLQFTVNCDMTSLFINNSLMFSDALATELKIVLLNDIAYSNRDNQTRQQESQRAFLALGNITERKGGLFDELKEKIKALDFSFSDLSPVCLPCKNNGMKIKFGSIF